LFDSGAEIMKEAERAEPRCCDLCGLRVGRTGIEHRVGTERFFFCCTGCLYVFQILYHSPDGPSADYRQTELYRACVAAGIIPRSQEDLTRVARAQEPPPASPETLEGLAEELSFRVEGMWCPACSLLIEEVLRRTEGIIRAKVFFLHDLARVKYLPYEVTPQNLLNSVSNLGYRASHFSDDSGEARANKDLLMRLGISAILTMNVMMISFALYFGFLQDLGEGAVAYLSYPLWAMTTPVLFYGGLPILKRAYGGLRRLQPTMDALIALGALSAYGYSVVQMSRGSLHVYFDTAAMLITIVLLGRYVETHSRGKVTREITALFQLTSQKVRVLREGVERWVASAAVEPGEEFAVEQGERIPVDGRILAGPGHMDESFLTGESRPVKRIAGDDVLAGGLLLEGHLILKASSKGSESSLNQIVDLLQQALTRKNRVELAADRIMGWLIPAVLFLATGTAAYLLLDGHASLDEAMLRAVTVLVITCPCALGIATPLAKVAFIGQARAKGILIRESSVVEKIKNLNTIVLDKTGTLTQGRFALRKIVSVEGAGEEEILGRAASVECLSDHLLAKEVLAEASRRFLQWEPASSYECHEGQGVKGKADTEIFIGNRQFMASGDMAIRPDVAQRAADMEKFGLTVVFVAFHRKVQGLLAFGDSIKESAGPLLSGLRSRGLNLWLVSGDSQETTKAIAEALGITHFQGQALPADKVQIVRRLQQEDKKVGMVGDGINDAAALAQADVGCALGARSVILRETSDVTILSDDPSKVLELMDLSAKTTRTIHQNLFFSFFYNIVGIPLAVSGVLNPIIAVLAMVASSLTVVGNTLRISTGDRREKSSGG